MSLSADETPTETEPNSESVRLSPDVVAALYAEYGEELRSFLVGVLRDAELAADALQAAFSKAAELGHTSREESRKAWLFRVAFNEALQIKRRGRIHERSTRQLAWIREQHEEARGEERLLRSEVIDRVRSALDQLPDAQRQVVRMRIYEEKTFAVIAEELGCPLGTVLTRMRLALGKLAGRLRDGELESE